MWLDLALFGPLPCSGIRSRPTNACKSSSAWAGLLPRLLSSPIFMSGSEPLHPTPNTSRLGLGFLCSPLPTMHPDQDCLTLPRTSGPELLHFPTPHGSVSELSCPVCLDWDCNQVAPPHMHAQIRPALPYLCPKQMDQGQSVQPSAAGLGSSVNNVKSWALLT